MILGLATAKHKSAAVQETADCGQHYYTSLQFELGFTFVDGTNRCTVFL